MCSVNLRHFSPLPCSVLFHLYRRTDEFDAGPLSIRFHDNVISAFQDTSNNYVVAYPGQPEVIAFNLAAMMLEQDEILLPFRTTQDNADPTTLAVYLGSFASKLLRGSGICCWLGLWAPSLINSCSVKHSYVHIVLHACILLYQLSPVLSMQMYGVCLHITHCPDGRPPG